MMQRPVAKFFADQGHRVYVALREMDAARDAFGDLDVKILPAPIRLTKVPPITKTPQTFAHVLHGSGMVDGPELSARVDAWRTIFDLTQPDLIAFDHSPTALLASRGSKAKRIIHGTGFYSPPRIEPLPNWRPWIKSDPSELVALEGIVLAAMNRQLALRGQPLLRRVADLYFQVDANFLSLIPEMDHFGSRKARYWGHRIESEGKIPEWPEGNGPRIFGYLKKHRGLPDLLGFLKQSGYPTLIYGDWVDEATRGRFECPSLRLLSEPVNLPTAARQCDAAILHATATSTFTFLIAGKPMVLLPLHLENWLTARSLSRSGAAVMASPRNPKQGMERTQLLLAKIDRFRSGAEKIAAKYSKIDWDRLNEEMLRTMHGFLPPAVV